MEELLIVGNKCSLYERKKQNKASEIFVKSTEDFNKRMKELASMLPPRKYNSKN
jgi:hypothetical protein